MRSTPRHGPIEVEVGSTPTRPAAHAATPVIKKPVMRSVPARIAAAREGGNDVAISPRTVDIPIASPAKVPAAFVPAVALPVQKSDPVSGAMVISAPPPVSSPAGIQITLSSSDATQVPQATYIQPGGGGGTTASSSEGSFTAEVTTPEQAAAEQRAGGFSFVTLLGGGAVGFVAGGPIGGAIGAVLGYFAGRAKR